MTTSADIERVRRELARQRTGDRLKMIGAGFLLASCGLMWWLLWRTL